MQREAQIAPETRGQANGAARGAILRVSKHGERRTRQRVGLPKKSVERNAQRALTDGIGHKEASGALKRYIAWLYERYAHNGNNIRIYGDKVWVFHDGILITVLNVPGKYRKAAKWQMEKRRNEYGGMDQG